MLSTGSTNTIYNTTHTPVLVCYLITRKPEIPLEQFEKKWNNIGIKVQKCLTELGAFYCEHWKTIKYSLPAGIERGITKKTSTDIMQILHYKSLEHLQNKRKTNEYKQALKMLYCDVYKDEIICQPRYGATFGNVEDASYIIVFPIKRHKQLTLEYMQRYWCLMHGPLVIQGIGAPKNNLKLNNQFMYASRPNVLQYQQWHSINDSYSWDGFAMLWFKRYNKLIHPPQDTKIIKFVNDCLSLDENRFVDMTQSEFFLATCFHRGGAINSKL
eukprot:33918_1